MSEIQLNSGPLHNDNRTYYPWIVSSVLPLLSLTMQISKAITTAKEVARRLAMEMPKTSIQVLLFDSYESFSVFCDTHDIKLYSTARAAYEPDRRLLLTVGLCTDFIHELIHSIIQDEINDCPLWLNEAIANHFQELRKDDKGCWNTAPNKFVGCVRPILCSGSLSSLNDILFRDNLLLHHRPKWLDENLKHPQVPYGLYNYTAWSLFCMYFEEKCKLIALVGAIKSDVFMDGEQLSTYLFSKSMELTTKDFVSWLKNQWIEEIANKRANEKQRPGNLLSEDLKEAEKDVLATLDNLAKQRKVAV